MLQTSKNIYPTNIQLKDELDAEVPIIIDKYEQSTDVSKIDTPSISENENYHNNQIIPWRKLYSKSRFDETQLEASLSSPLLKFLIKYNKWPVIVVSSIIVSLLTIPMDWAITWLNNLKYGYCRTGVFIVRESCPAGDWYLVGENMTIGFSFASKVSIMLLLTIIFACLGLRISTKSPWIAKSGISELKMIISGHVNNDFLQPAVIVRKYIALLFVCASGGLLISYEGPLIHISCGVINCIIDLCYKNFQFFRNLNNAAIRREMISIGFTIGISVAFGAPIGGLLFTVENLKLGMKFNSLMWNGFVCSSIATFIFFKFHPFKRILINEAFTVDIGNGWIFFETLPYLFVGLTCGLLSLVYNNLHLKLFNFRTSTRFPEFLKNPYVEIINVSLITQILHYPLEFDHLTLNNMLASLFYDCSSTAESYYQAVCKSSHQTFELIYYLAIIFVQSSYSYMLQIPGGILLPSLIIGAIIGRIIGEFVEFIQHHFGANIFLQCYQENKKCVSPGSYAIVGAASFFAGVTNTSVAAVVIVFEVTGAVTYLIPLMLGVVASKTTVDIFGSTGFYEMWIEKINKNYISSEISDSLKLAYLSEIPIGDLANSNENKVLYLNNDITVGELKLFFEDDNEAVDIKNDGLVLLNDDLGKEVSGWISYVDIADAIDGFDEKKFVSFKNSTDQHFNSEEIQLNTYVVPVNDLFIVNSQFTLLSAYHLMNKMLVTNIIVCDKKNKFSGVLTITDLSEIVKK